MPYAPLLTNLRNTPATNTVLNSGSRFSRSARSQSIFSVFQSLIYHIKPRTGKRSRSCSPRMKTMMLYTNRQRLTTNFNGSVD